jgi:hypothetical protein
VRSASRDRAGASAAEKRAAGLEVLDQKMAAALSIWKAAPAPCKTDEVLTHILSKFPE